MVTQRTETTSLPDLHRYVSITHLAQYTREDQLLEAIEELPNQGQIQVLVDRLRTPALRLFAIGLLGHCVHTAKTPSLHPYEFTIGLSALIATAEEVAASTRGVAKVLRDRDEMKSS